MTINAPQGCTTRKIPPLTLYGRQIPADHSPALHRLGLRLLFQRTILAENLPTNAISHELV